MIITVLGSGTSQGVPQIGCNCKACTSSDPRDNRTRSSIMITTDSTNVVIDTGPEFRIQMIREKVKSLDAVILTHEHADHLHGLDDIRSFTNKTQQAMNVFAEKRVQNTIEKVFDYVFTSKYAGIAKMNLINITEESFTIGDLEFIPIRLFHHKLPVYGFRVGTFAYLTDFKTIAPRELSKLQGVETLIIEALHIKPHISHINLEESLALIEKIGAKRNYLTHISHYMPIYKDLCTQLPSNILPAYDGLKLTIE